MFPMTAKRRSAPCWLVTVAFALQACILLLSFNSAAGGDVSVPLSVTAIQNALNAASAGTTIVVGVGELDLVTTTLVINKAGVSLRGAGAGLTIFKSSQTSLQRLLSIEGTPVDTPTGVTPTVIEGITFLNSALTVPLAQAIGPRGAIQVKVSGPQGSQSVIRNCEFLNFVTTYPTSEQLATLDIFAADRWRVEGNRFDGLTACIITDGSNTEVVGNTFTR